MRLHEALLRSGGIAANIGSHRAERLWSEAAPAAPPPEVSVVTVQRGTVPVTIELPGRTSAYLVAQVRARVDGIVLKREFKEGSRRQGGPAPLPDRSGALSAPRSTAPRRRSGKRRPTSRRPTRRRSASRCLVAGNAVSKQDYDNAVAARDQAVANVAFGKAAVETARINLGYTDVVSPITGRIGISLVTEGAFVQASAATLMTTVQQIDPIYVDLNQSSVEGLQLRRDVASGRMKLSGPELRPR